MIVAELSAQGLAERLAGPGLSLRTGPLVTRIRSRIQAIVEGIAFFYADHPVDEADAFADFQVSVVARRWAGADDRAAC